MKTLSPKTQKTAENRMSAQKSQITTLKCAQLHNFFIEWHFPSPSQHELSKETFKVDPLHRYYHIPQRMFV